MRLSLLPSELLGVLLVSSSRIVQYAIAGPTVNVALQASFNAPPYILELLLVTLKFPIFLLAGRTDILQGDSGRREPDCILSYPR